MDALCPFRQPLWATVGDEFQAVFDDVAAALRATAIAQLLFSPEVDCRFGLGLGELRTVGDDATIQDGSAWWFAREAIVEAHSREDKANPYLRTWLASDDSRPDIAAIVNSYLLVRDHTIRRMNPRERCVAAGALLGRRQSELATEERISQSAVSQSLQRSGVATLVAAHQVLDELGT
ncbi:SatD family (SatD) [Sanguibacter gelidistatuariae]|uniref:SatD family (SatD) n=1 Tax=Sanguibacter gelidistatuariae TaxID=1814289 RepID=A0A1G6NCZ8_9MICO|nr:SatD family protein [Sanguibacter gelidistatuariae]SDC65703.1 SatD family (SatD) [Sanguibacter gelidistatuariae]